MDRVLEPELMTDPEQAETYSGGEPEVLKRDFFHSLGAAFTLVELREQLAAAGLPGLRAEMVSDRHWVAWGRLQLTER